MTLKDKIAVITGATGSLGAVVARHFIALGARVALPYRTSPDLPQGGLAIRCDVTVESDVEAMLAQVNETLGPPEILLNLVGGYASGQKLVDLDLEIWHHMLSLNLTSAFLCSKHALRYMLPAGRGRIVNVSSKTAYDCSPGAAAYAVAKAGVLTLTGCLAKECKGTGISAMAIVPSAIDSPATRESMPKVDPAKFVTREQIAETLAWLASDAGAPVNGSIIQLSGGM